ncbi:MAG TPA: YceI family protein [Candidatus Limnocylindrales bacterium]|nr:YceI family protein [Candidatus Limnocylindrales bacterium]
MRVWGWKSAGIATLAMAGIAVLLSAAPTRSKVQKPSPGAQEIVLDLDPAQSKVHYTVESTLHTVHGTFNLKGGSVHFDPESGRAGGEVSVYATSGDSGNGSRDEKMHKEVLESQKYPDAVFTPSQVEGKVTLEGASDVNLHGVMLLHGKEHEMVVPVHAELAAGRWMGKAKFEVPYIQWGMKDPSNWLLKVKPIVRLELDMVGTTKSPQ